MLTGNSDISRPRSKPRLFCLALILAFVGLVRPAAAQNVASAGGLVAGSKIVRVTTLADDGRGSLRAALAQCGPCVIVFDIGGVIELKSNLAIEKDHVTMAGETAPSPGILLHGATLNIRASELVVSHIAVYAGSSDDPKIAENRDGISVYGSESRKHTIRNVILRNVSVGWGVDENIGLQGLVDGVRIERSLIAQPLRNGGHPKGVHSMNVLLSSGVARVIMAGNILAGAEQRNPRINTGNRVSFINNLIAGTGAFTGQLDTSLETRQKGLIDMIGNFYLPSSATSCKNKAIQLDEKFLTVTPQTRLYLADNLIDETYNPGCLELTNADEALLADAPLNTVQGWETLPAEGLKEVLIGSAGSRPVARNPVDQAVIAQIMDGTIAPLEDDRAAKVLLKDIKPKESVEWGKGAGPVIFVKDLKEIQQSLCKRFNSVGGTGRCPHKA